MIKNCRYNLCGALYTVLALFGMTIVWIIGGLLQLDIWQLLCLGLINAFSKIIALRYMNEEFYENTVDFFKNWQSNDFVEEIICKFYTPTKMFKILKTHPDYNVTRIELHDLSKTSNQKVHWRYLNSRVDKPVSTNLKKILFQIFPDDFGLTTDVKLFSIKSGMSNKIEMKLPHH